MVADRTFEILEKGTFSAIRFHPDIEDASIRADEIYNDLARFVGQAECLRLNIELADMKYVPSSMLGVFARLHAQGVDVHLSGASQEIVEVLEATRLDTILHVNDNELDSTEETIPPEDTISLMADGPDCTPVALSAYFVNCPSCSSECQVDKHELGHRFDCSACEREFSVTAELLAGAAYVRARCPACDHILRVRGEYVRKPLACNHCEQHIEIRAVV